jgi:hypothetical protein
VAIFLLDVEREGVVPAVFPKWRPSIRREWVVGASACTAFATTIGLVAVNKTQTYMALRIRRRRQCGGTLRRARTQEARNCQFTGHLHHSAEWLRNVVTSWSHSMIYTGANASADCSRRSGSSFRSITRHGKSRTSFAFFDGERHPEGGSRQLCI